MRTRSNNTPAIILGLSAVVLLFAFIYTNNVTHAPTVVGDDIRPVIIDTFGSSITGRATPGHFVWAYPSGPSCPTDNGLAVYGADRTDADGNFSISIPVVAERGVTKIVVFATDDGSITKFGTGACLPEADLSEPVEFIVTN